ncbi:MAG: hypothetical protein AAGG06_00860 [Pseudomonadota bacterium]
MIRTAATVALAVTVLAAPALAEDSAERYLTQAERGKVVGLYTPTGDLRPVPVMAPPAQERAAIGAGVDADLAAALADIAAAEQSVLR